MNRNQPIIARLLIIIIPLGLAATKIKKQSWLEDAHKEAKARIEL